MMRTIKILFLLIICSVNLFGQNDVSKLITYSTDKWHIKFSLPETLSVDEFARVKDLSNKGAHIELVNNIFPDDSLIPLNDFVAARESGIYCGDGPDTMSEFDSIYKIDSIKNNSGFLFYKMYVTIVDKIYQDTIVQWVSTTRHVEGPIYYIKAPTKYYDELDKLRAFSIIGDSSVSTAIVDYFEIY